MIAEALRATRYAPQPTGEGIAGYYEQEAQGDPQKAWDMAKYARDVKDPKGFPKQELADAEHYLWAKYSGGKGLPNAILGMGGPYVHDVGKKALNIGGALGVAEPRPWSSDPTWDQFRLGQRGAVEGLVKQLQGDL